MKKILALVLALMLALSAAAMAAPVGVTNSPCRSMISRQSPLFATISAPAGTGTGSSSGGRNYRRSSDAR